MRAMSDYQIYCQLHMDNRHCRSHSHQCHIITFLYGQFVLFFYRRIVRHYCHRGDLLQLICTMGDCGFIYYCCMYHQWLINCCFHSDAGFDMHNGALLCHGNPRIITYCCSHGNLLIKCVFALQLYILDINYIWTLVHCCHHGDLLSLYR